jgi:glycerol-1-phosphate dehydrogenase [NAD(P)+]
MAPLKHPEPRVARPVYGRDMLSVLPKTLFERPIVITQPEPWAALKGRFGAVSAVRFAATMDHGRISDLAAALEDGSAVFGIGGGMAADLAKFVSWKKSLPLVLMPSMLSVDAAFCKAIAVREEGRVRYIGAVFPDYFLIDYDLIRTAPQDLNRAGVGDIISIFTALWDWWEAGRRLGERHDPAVAEESQRLLDRLYAGAREIRDVTDESLQLLSELYMGEVRLCEMMGNSRPEEGSEHYIAYCVEAMTRRSFLHGRLVGLGVLLAGAYQGQDTGPVTAFLDEIRLRVTLKDTGLSREEMKAALLNMDAYLKAEKHLLPGVFHFRGAPDERAADDLLDAIP